jgi:hypothetical protein
MQVLSKAPPAVKLHHHINNICILTVYRAPTGNFTCFLNSLETILNKLYTKSINIILCDVNINYLDDSGTNKLKLNALLTTYHLCSIVDFPTRIASTSATAIDNFFIDKHRNEISSITSLPNGLLDHGSQLLTLNNILLLESSSYPVIRRLIT